MDSDIVSAPVRGVPVFTGTHSDSRWKDRGFRLLCLAGAMAVVLLLILVLWQLVKGSQQSMAKFGWRFLTSTAWDPSTDDYGALPYIFGTVVSSIIALLIAVPLSVGTAVYLTDLAPMWLRQPLTSLIEMLAAVPSVIWGLWGIFVLEPLLRDYVYPFLQKWFGFLPFFQGPTNIGVGLLAAGFIVAIMILPIVTSISREVLRSVPTLQREAAYALGATRWEMTRIAVLSYARRGLFGAAILGLGRALGETMAVTMVIGNSPFIGLSLFKPADTLASVIAKEFPEAQDILLSSLFELGLVLLGVTILINVLAQIMIHTFTTKETRRVA